MSQQPSIPERCRQLLKPWRDELKLNSREQSLFKGALINFDRQLLRLTNKHCCVAVFGRVGVGKSSLLNALLNRDAFLTDVAHGCTRQLQREVWEQRIQGLHQVELIDTPGIDEIAAAGRARLALRVARQADLVLFVIDSDLTRIDLEALRVLQNCGKPILLALNRCDCWPDHEVKALISSIRQRLHASSQHLEILSIAAAPRQAKVLPDGRVRSFMDPPQVEPLRNALINLLKGQGEVFVALNALHQAEFFHNQLHRDRLQRNRKTAQGMIGRFAALKATGVAANPLLLFDLAGGLACDSALIMKLCQIYGLSMGSSASRRLIRKISSQNALLGGAQFGIQLTLAALRQLLLIAAPFTAGLSLAPAAPVALAQAALAVYSTRRTGRLTAIALMRSSRFRGGQPGALIRRLSKHDTDLKQWLKHSVDLQGLQPSTLGSASNDPSQQLTDQRQILEALLP